MPTGLTQWIFGSQPSRDQRLRLRRFFMSLSSYAMWYGIGWLCLWFGLLDISVFWMVASGVALLATQVIIYLLIRFDMNLRLNDPSLTLAQMLVALGWSLLLIAVSREIRGVVLSVFMIVLLFGIFALGKREFLISAALAFIGYVALVLYERITEPGLFSEGFYIVSVTILGGVLLWTTLFGSYVSSLRYKLSARNQELEEALQRIRTLAEHDDLTGLYNRRYIMANLRREIARHHRKSSTFSVILIDLDHFKQVNDKFGHSAGDRLLQEFSKFMEEALRDMDMVVAQQDHNGTFGRYGGEEFIALLPDTDLRGAERAAERLRASQEARINEHATVPHVTLSAGVAEYVEGESVESLLRRADQALYDAKHAGRNCVRSAA
ncbi:MAG: GGDEF domain-containing protein [Gammaproteobacteria bacterium]|nr:GGDEF domain-containing protein [Gammaproteobacteria bacterium]